MYQPNPKLEQLRAQQERDLEKLEQLRHREQRLQNRIRYLESTERRQRYHRLITRGASVEHLWPEVMPLTEHENELRRFYLARRKLKEHFNEDGKLPISAWRRELAGLEQTVSRIKAEHLPLREEWKQLNRVKTCVSNTLRQMGQTSHKRRDMEL